MVDVTEKKATQRKAKARSIVVLPAAVLDLLNDGEIESKKGPVFQTAIIAGVMAAKRTAELIPFCHQLSIEACSVDIFLNEHNYAVVECTVSVFCKTGVEMEALVGASTAALTIYDMCKGVSHQIIIRETKLVAKSGGKSDWVDDT